MNVLVAAGTRPEAIKLAPVVLALRARADWHTTFCLGGQHEPHMLDPVTTFFDAPADIVLDPLSGGEALAGSMARLVCSLDGVIERVRPDWVLVQGDTTTAFASGLAAYYRQVAVAHVEAGLRSNNIYQPFPEEMNRRLITRLAHAHFAPTTAAAAALTQEGVAARTIVVTGNSGIDALLLGQQIIARPEHSAPLAAWLSGELAVPDQARVILLTCHRRENAGAPVAELCRAIERIGQRFPDVIFVTPLHPNPEFGEPMRAALAHLPWVRTTPPLPYNRQMALLARCHLVITDSGGLQEEAPALGKPVLVLRRVTERPEGVELGVARLLGSSAEAIVEAAADLLGNEECYALMARRVLPYGDGHAADRIVAWLARQPGLRAPRS
jgi:UDP-N-acetylglucosamine 2-epimerase